MRARPLVQLDASRVPQFASSTIVTANARLKQAWGEAFELHRIAGAAEQVPRVMELTEYLRECFALATVGIRYGRLLSREAERLAWIETAPRLEDFDAHDLQPRITDAWNLIHEWELLRALPLFDDNENHRLFRDWARRYNSYVQSRGWISEAELPSIIAAEIQAGRVVAEPLLLVGFDVVPPGLVRLLDAIRGVDVKAEFVDVQQSPARIRHIAACENAEQELHAAIVWAKHVVQTASEPVSIGIVVPDATERYDRIVGHLDSLLRPDDPDAEPGNAPYNISGGVPLSDVAVVADALDLLGWLIAPLHFKRVDRLLRSPFLDLNVRPGRSSDSSLPESFDAERFSEIASSAKFRSLLAARPQRPAALDLMISHVRRLLAIAGWPNSPMLRSEAFQAHRTFEGLLEELAASAECIRSSDFGVAIDHVRRAASRRLFAPARPQAPIQVLSHLETVGLEFTHLWVLGLDELRWPSPAHPTPFVPRRLLRSAGVSRSDADSESAFARRMTARWIGSANCVVFSHPTVRDEEHVRLSSIVAEQLHEATTMDVARIEGRHPRLVRSKTELAPRSEAPVGPPPKDPSRHRGTAVIRDQSACPFRAFARHRLGAVQPRIPHTFLDEVDRGTVVHDALRRVFAMFGSPIDRDRLDDTTITERAVKDALATYWRGDERFRASEDVRVRGIVEAWMQLERRLPPFRTLEVERPIAAEFAGIAFEMRVDRIDELGGARVVLDYKTGAISANSLIGTRPEEPQLPMYALSVPHVHGVAFAHVRAQDSRLTGWADIELGRQYGLRSAPQSFGADWDNLMNAWRDRITALAAEFASGVADVAPRDSKACRECDLHSLCRIRESRRIDID